MASTYKLDDEGGRITVAAGPMAEDDPTADRLLRLEVHGHALNGGMLAFLDIEARAWLQAKLDEWDAE